jgi:hypothetical protein
MATSGNTIFLVNRSQIIESALRKILFTKGQTPDATDTAEAALALNAIVAEFQTLGMQLWSRVELPIQLVSGQRDYTIGVGKAINAPYPTTLLQAILRDNASNSQIDMQILSRYDFNLLPLTTLPTGQPVNVTYQPFINYGVLSVWPTPDQTIATSKTMIITYQRPLEVFDSATDTPDFPQEWANALIYSLALSLADEYGVPVQDKQWLEKQADKHLTMALQGSGEDASLFFQPAKRY